jgi:NADPH:quinone reductase-like Zn-dependent oxidoreductase
MLLTHAKFKALAPKTIPAVRELTSGRGVDQVVEIGGGTLEQSLKSTALSGQVNFIGRLSGATSKIDINLLYNSVATLRVIFAGNRAQFIAMNRVIAVNRLKPIIDRVFPFEQVVEAFRLRKRPAVWKDRHQSQVITSRSRSLNQL